MKEEEERVSVVLLFVNYFKTGQFNIIPFLLFKVFKPKEEEKRKEKNGKNIIACLFKRKHLHLQIQKTREKKQKKKLKN